MRRKFAVREEAQDTLFFGTMELSDLLVQARRHSWPDQLAQRVRELPVRVAQVATLDRSALMAVAAFRGKQLMTYASTPALYAEQYAWCGSQPYREEVLAALVADLNGREQSAAELTELVTDAYLAGRVNEREQAMLLAAIDYARLTLGAAAEASRPLFLSCPTAPWKTEGNTAYRLYQQGTAALSCDLLYVDSGSAANLPAAREFVAQADARYIWYVVAEGEAVESNLLAAMEARGPVETLQGDGFLLYAVTCERREGLTISPLGGGGAPARLLAQVLPRLPNRIHTFVDLFCSEGNMGANVLAQEVWLCDADATCTGLLKLLYSCPRAQVLAQVQRIIREYGLSESELYGFEHYGTSGAEGLGAYNKQGYLRLREHFNSTPPERRGVAYWCELLTLLAYSAGSQARCNAEGKFNLPVGKRDVNTQLKNRLSQFQQALKQRQCRFATQDFRALSPESLPAGSVVYAEPPMLLKPEGAYEAPRTWKEQDERDLLDYLDRVHAAGHRFALVSVLAYRVVRNELVVAWLKAHAGAYRMMELETDLDSPYKLALIVNY